MWKNPTSVSPASQRGGRCGSAQKLGANVLDLAGDQDSSAQKDVRHILHANVRFPALAVRDVVGNQKMSLHDEDFLVADPVHQRSLRQKRDTPRGIAYTLHLDRRKIQQGLANMLRLFWIRLSLLGQLNRRVWLSGGNNGQRHRSEIGRKLAVQGIEAPGVVRLLVGRRVF